MLIKGKHFSTIKDRMNLQMYLEKAQDRKDPVMVAELTDSIDRWEKWWIKELDRLPSKFSKNYGEKEYTLDCNNIRNYWTKWKREDAFFTKKSLNRVKQYEKRESLEPFHELDEALKVENNIKRMTEMYG